MSKMRFYKRYFLTLILCLAAVMPVSAAAATIDDADKPREVISEAPQIAIILPLSGPFAEYGRDLKKGYELGFSRAQAAVAAAAAKYKVEYLDSESDPETARTLINLIASEGDAVIASGTPLNATAWTASRACEENGLPYLIIGADQDNLINNESFFTFRLTQNDSSLKRMLKTYIAAQKPEIKTMGVIFGNSPCALSRARQLRQLSIAKGIDLAIWERWKELSRNRDNFYDLLNIIKERRPQILFLVTGQDIANRFWVQGRRLEIIPAATISLPVNCVTDLPEADDHNPKPTDKLPCAAPWSTPGLILAEDGNDSPQLNLRLAQGEAAAEVIINCLKKSPSLSAGEIIKSLESTTISTFYGPVKFTQGPSGHQNQLPWYLVSNEAANGTKIIFPVSK